MIRLVLVLPILLSTSVMAATPNWSYVESGYHDIELDDIPESAEGWFAGGSFGFFKQLHVFGRYTSAEIGPLGVTSWWAGAGWHGGLGEKADVSVEVAYTQNDLDIIRLLKGTDESGYFGRIGARWRIIKLFEIGGWYRYQDIGDSGSRDVWEANLVIHLWRVGLGLSYETQDSVDTMNAFVRFNIR